MDVVSSLSPPSSFERLESRYDDIFRNRPCSDDAASEHQSCPCDGHVAIYLVRAYNLFVPEASDEVALIARRCTLLWVEEASLTVDGKEIAWMCVSDTSRNYLGQKALA